MRNLEDFCLLPQTKAVEQKPTVIINGKLHELLMVI